LLGGAGFAIERMTFAEPGTAPVENLYARLGNKSPHLVFAGHTDVVPVGDQAAWSQGAFEAAVVDGVLIGRGAVDMKSAIAAFAAASAKAIAAGRIRGAAIDAFEEEPLPADSALRTLGDKVLLSPHSAAYTEGGELRQGVAWATRSVLTALAGKIPDNVYNREVVPRWKERFGGASISN